MKLFVKNVQIDFFPQPGIYHCAQAEFRDEQMKKSKSHNLLIGFCLICVLCMTNPFFAQEEILSGLSNPVTEKYLEKNLKKYSPKLILTPILERGLKHKLGYDEALKPYFKYLEKESESILQKPLLERKLEGFRMLSVSVEMVERMGILCMVYRIDKNPEILERIDAEVKRVCSFSDWNNQHFLDVAEMSFAVALAIDWTGEWLPESTVDMAKTALIEKGLKPSFNEDGIRMFWINSYNNWNAVCHSGMIAAALVTFDKNPELATKTIHRALEKLTNSLKEYAPNGVYPEGPSYWGYGTYYTALASSMLSSALGQDFGIYESPGFKEGPDFFLQSIAPSGEYFNFCDCDGELNGYGALLLAWFGAKTGDGKYYIKEFFDNPEQLGRFAGPGLVWLSEFEPQKNSRLATEWFGKGRNPVAYFRNKDNKNQYYLAAKGGTASVIHGNMDAGTFVFELDGVRWVIDPGNQSYYALNKIGFDLSGTCQECERWTLLTKSNKGHSTITINDERHHADAYAALTHFEKGNTPNVTFDMTEISGGALNAHHRTFTKDTDHSVLIEDDIEINDSTNNITWGLMTVAEVEMAVNGAILKQDGKQLNLEILSPEGLSISVISLDPPPLSIDKTIEDLKRIEIRIPAWTIENNECNIRVRLYNIN